MMIVREESRTDLGLIRVHKNAISSIASIAAMDVPGVKSVNTSLRTKLMDLIGNKGNADIKVEINKNDEVKIDIPVLVRYGFNIPEIANAVQENVRLALEKMTNLSVKDINVNIVGIERG